MGDHLATIDMGRKDGGCCSPFRRGGKLDLYLTQCRPDEGLPLYQVASWSIQSFGHNTWAKKWEGAPVLPLFWGGSCIPIWQDIAWAPYEVASWSIQPFGHKRRGPEIGDFWGPSSLPFFWEGARSPSNTVSSYTEAYLSTKWHLNPSSHLATMDISWNRRAVPLFGRPGSPSNTMLTDMGRQLWGMYPLGGCVPI